MTPKPHAGADDEAGFTLVELLLVAAILGVVIVGISAALMVGLKTFAGTDNKIISSTDAQLVSAYLPADLQSVGTDPNSIVADPGHTSSAPRGSFAVTANTDCSGLPNVLKLSWRDNLEGNTKTYVAAYTVVQASDGDWQLVRYYCDPDAPTKHNVVARNLAGNGATDEIVTVTDDGAPGTYPKVALQLRSKARAPGDPTNFTYTITGTRRTPNS
jgi:prepilin-type N-terminal cleavage/methylation domain-containing protein